MYTDRMLFMASLTSSGSLGFSWMTMLALEANSTVALFFSDLPFAFSFSSTNTTRRAGCPSHVLNFCTKSSPASVSSSTVRMTMLDPTHLAEFSLAFKSASAKSSTWTSSLRCVKKCTMTFRRSGTPPLRDLTLGVEPSQDRRRAVCLGPTLPNNDIFKSMSLSPPLVFLSTATLLDLPSLCWPASKTLAFCFALYGHTRSFFTFSSVNFASFERALNPSSKQFRYTVSMQPML
mmetsp:Transcript_46212/g.116374  ORF Transcript_46212/g.116374 Transcript_46212/m.116374 type:complete len:234 (+) Transcript_46212:2087-2788(+)